MYQAPGRYRRTAAERASEQLAWDRSDDAFFAAGACHILAWAFLQRYPDAGFRAVGLRAVGEAYASHVIVTDGRWAFDYAGWTRERELLDVIEEFEGRKYELVDIGHDLSTFCATHVSRSPEQFAHDPWPRATAHLTRVGGDVLPQTSGV